MRLSVLCPSRPNSEYLAHFICNFFTATHDLADTELLVMVNQVDVWNRDLRKVFSDRVRFFEESGVMGRYALHEYYNVLAGQATGDWLALCCEDFQLMDGWDNRVRDMARLRNPNPLRPHVILPMFAPGVPGFVMHVLSRGWLNAVGGVISEHHSVDSWVNTMLDHLGKAYYSTTPDALFDDYTHNKPAKGQHPYQIPQGETMPHLTVNDDAKARIQVYVDKIRSVA